ncbi:anti-sigma factor [Salinarimonas ramus]|uniref:Regulator of SigK n=1 Tax=Salinarimonas ramus TaxID=690164 RepID=A0A917V2R3_9HYPH|nr:anti-sigma factor [Salinarimonas ramus]GGK23987.1 anti-sigma K factor RskA [Salinarimonas ramus]
MSAGTDMFEGEDDALAGEYVLGTLPPAERVAFEARLPREPALARAVADWQERLAPLAEAVDPVEPPADLLARIEARLEGRAAGSVATAAGAAGERGGDVVSLDEVRRLRRSLAGWRLAAGGLGVLAAALVAVAILAPGTFAPLPPDEPAAERYVAVVDRGGELPALIVQVDVASGLVRVRAPAAEAPPEQALELWLVADGDAPRSLGLVEDASDIRIEPAVARSAPGATLAVSVEPPGGSPTGAPTGPVVYTGVLIPQ